MRIFQSFWTKPAIDQRWDQSGQLEANVWLFALSAVYAKRQGVTLVLYTDTLGKKLLGHLPYDRVYTTLDNIPSNIPTMIWAYGKFMALREEPLGSIHIDGDVFLKKPEVIREMGTKDYDLIIQNKEWTHNTYESIEDIMARFGEIDREKYANYQTAYNCGVVGFTNAQLKKSYLDYYFGATASVAKNRALRAHMEADKYFCVDLTLEQHSLAMLAQKYKTKILLKVDNEDYWGQAVRNRAEQLGYQHLIGKEKYEYIDRVKFTLLALDQDVYFKTKAAIQKYNIH